MSTRQESDQKTRRPSQSSGYPGSGAGSGDSKSRIARGAGGKTGLIQEEENLTSLPLGDILVDVDAGPGGVGLVVWIVGG